MHLLTKPGGMIFWCFLMIPWSKQLLFLIKEGFIETPKLSRKAIQDKNKVDGLLRFITLCQVCWFVVNIIGRGATGLSITCLELTASAFIICTLATSICWREKPADVVVPERIETDHSMVTIYEHVCNVMDVKKMTIYHRTPLDIVSRKEWAWSKFWSNWIMILKRLQIDFGPHTVPVDRFENTISLPLPLLHYLFFSVVTLAYCGIFVVAWSFQFPTKIEQHLWRAVTLALLSVCIVYALVTHFVLDAYPILKSKLLRPWNRQKIPKDHSTWFGQKMHRIAQRIRNNSVSRDPSLDLPLKAILPVHVLGALYCCCRTYIFIEDIIELRSLPSSAYATVDWSTFLPHLN